MIKKDAAQVKAHAEEIIERLSLDIPEEKKKIRKLNMIIRYANGINRFYLLACGVLVFLFVGFYYSLYPDLDVAFVSISLFFGFLTWLVIWGSIVFQIKLWNRTLSKVQTT